MRLLLLLPLLLLACTDTAHEGIARACYSLVDDDGPTFARDATHRGLRPADVELDEPTAFASCAEDHAHRAQLVDEDDVHVFVSFDAFLDEERDAPIAPDDIFDDLNNTELVFRSQGGLSTAFTFLSISRDDAPLLVVHGGGELVGDHGVLTVEHAGASALPAFDFRCGSRTAIALRASAGGEEVTAANGEIVDVEGDGGSFTFAHLASFAYGEAGSCEDVPSNVTLTTWVAFAR